ncbi:DNA helicase [Bacillus phage Wes44]|uniref:Nucleoside triphosphate hydrolase n=1 Tax=Bacillus phage Wes44 TaxID=2283012 RepID=A0A346FK10_9CAUD|nr:DNA helicase [Bacillus phage Wes44]AXN58315.1 nucleoside triphosphate hydrolase [Bacillus phage Wes44]
MDELVISFGSGRRSKTWKQEYLTWNDFVKRLSKWEEKRVTVAEYKKLKANKKKYASKIADLKDGKAFVGGAIKGDRRTKETVETRSMLTLDADSIEDLEGFLFDVEMVLDGVQYLVHSTLSHTPEEPRLRLLVPLSEEVDADKHEAIARKIAGNIGMGNFDRTTFDVNRLVYLPSKLMDAETIMYDNVTGFEPLDVDKVLDEYFDWTNMGEWDRHEGEEERNHLHMKKDDPLNKPGNIGVFNRTYSITDAIDTFLSDKYELCDDGSGRYTYVGGSTAAGLVIYDDDTFCHSHHSTDPISGQMVNAYDLVRIHLYGDSDYGMGDAGKIGKMPSDKRMAVLMDKDKLCKKTRIEEKRQGIMSDFSDEDFDDVTAAEPVEVEDWETELDMEGEDYLLTAKNLMLILTKGPMEGVLAYNEITNRPVMLKPAPWMGKNDEDRFEGKDEVPWTNNDMHRMRHWLFDMYDFRSKDALIDAFITVCLERSYNPIKRYIEAQEWDGIERAESIFIDMVGAEDNAYVRQVTRKTLLGAVTRLYRPGSKFDYMPVLVGGQGVGKSSLLERLAVKQAWYNGSLTDFKGKEAGEQLQAGWIFEIGELAAMNKSGIEEVKNFLTLTTDKFRPAYGAMAEEYPRKAVFFGTTNKMDFLVDKTGNRRFMPITVKRMPEGKEHWNTIPMNKPGDAGYEYIAQLWAEVYQWYKAGETVFLDNEIIDIATKIQKDHTMVDDFEERLLEWLDEPEEADEFEIGEPMLRTKVTSRDIYKQVLNGSDPVIPRQISNQIKLIMNNLDGWEHKKSIRYIDENGKEKVGAGYIRIINL